MQTSLFKFLSFYYHLHKQNTAKECETVANFIENTLEWKGKNPGRGG